MPAHRFTLADVVAHYRRLGRPVPAEVRDTPVQPPSVPQIASVEKIRSGGRRRAASLLGATREQKTAYAGLPPGAAMGTQLPLRLSNEKSSHQHWAKLRKRVQFEREYVYTRLMSLWEEGPLLGLPLVVTITRIAPGTFDDDNLALACSAVRDAIADWLHGQYLHGNDRQAGLEFRYEQRRGAPRFYAVEIRVERPKAQRKRVQNHG